MSQLPLRSIGPAGMSGRITAIAVSPDDRDLWYVGSASGGLWKTANAGTTFTPVFDEQPLQSIGAVAIAPSNPDVVYVGTGEGNPRNSQSSGAGVFKSYDGGESWEPIGLEASPSPTAPRAGSTDPRTADGAGDACWEAMRAAASPSWSWTR